MITFRNHCTDIVQIHGNESPEDQHTFWLQTFAHGPVLRGFALTPMALEPLVT